MSPPLSNHFALPAPSHRRGWRTCARSLVFLACGLLATRVAGAEISKEYQVKAAFLYNFTKFVEWPAERFAHDDEPILIGVFGRAALTAELEKIVRDRRVNGRPIRIVNPKTLAEAQTLHVLFVAAGEEKNLALTDLARLPGVLTVGETDRFDVAGVVKFITAGDKVRFEINTDVADHAGLRISAQLLKLATVVRKKS
jgi:hypothetical protein